MSVLPSTRARGSIPSVCLSWAEQEESCALITCLGEAQSMLMHTKGFVRVWVVLIGTGLAICVCKQQAQDGFAGPMFLFHVQLGEPWFRCPGGDSMVLHFLSR